MPQSLLINMKVKNPIIKLLYKSCENYSDNFYGPLKLNDERNELLSPLQMSCISCLVIVGLTNISLDKEKIWNRILFILRSRGLQEFLHVVCCLAFAIILLPLLLAIFVTFKIHKELIKSQLLRDNKSLNFKGFIEGEDVVWMLENKNTKSIINVLAFVDVNGDFDLLLPESLLQSIRDRIYTKLMLPNLFPKLFYRTQRSPSGYFYWIDENKLTINEYVRIIENDCENVEISEDEFRNKMSEICNQSLPAEDTALWECLISRQAMRCKNGELKIPVSQLTLFKVNFKINLSTSR